MPDAASALAAPAADAARVARRRCWALVLLWLVPDVWSSNYLIARSAGAHAPPHLPAFGRWGLVFVRLLSVSACIQREWSTRRSTPGNEKGLQVIDSQAFWVLVALQGLEPRTRSLLRKPA